MPYVAAAATGSALLSVFTLVLALGMLRRMRAQTVQLAELNRGAASFGPDRMLPPDTVVAEFTTTTTHGEPVSRDRLEGTTLVAFLAPGCKPCETLLPQLVGYAERFPGGREQVLAVLTMAHPEDSAAYAERLDGVARVVIEDGLGPFSEAFQATHLPAMYLVGSGGVILAGGVDARFFGRLPVGARANGH